MKSTRRLTLSLRVSAAAIAALTLGVWLSTGHHTGWTQTSVLTTQHDEITGIDYPVRKPGFVAGVEVLAAGAGLAAALAGLSYWAQRHTATRA